MLKERNEKESMFMRSRVKILLKKVQELVKGSERLRIMVMDQCDHERNQDSPLIRS